MAGKVTSLEGKTPKQPLREVTSIERSDLFSGRNFERYNPDQLASRKGGLKLYTKMMQDEQVKAVVEFKRASIIGRGFTFEFHETELPREEQEARLQVMEQIVRRMRGSFTDSMRAVLRGMVNGYSLTEIVTDRVTISDKTYVGIAQLLPRKVDDFKFFTDEYGELKKFAQTVGGKEKELDYSRFIHYVQNPEIDPYYGESELVAAYRAWFLKDTTTKFWAQYLERFAGGFLKIGLGSSGIVPGSTEYAALQQVLSNLRGTMGILLPDGVEADLMHPPSAEVFQKAVEFHDLSIAKALLIPNLLGLSNSGNTGAYAQSQTQLEVYFMTVAADSARLEQVLNDQLFKPIAAQNWDDGEFPRFKFKTASLEQTKWMIEAWTKLTGASLAVPTEEDEEYLRKLLGMPTRGEEDTELVTPQQAQEQANSTLDRAASEEDREHQKKLAEQEVQTAVQKKFTELRELFHAEHDQKAHGNWANAPEYGNPRVGSATVRAVHYSKEPRAELDSSKFGTGARAAEASRVKYSKDARLRERINFYVDDGEGVQPEATVGKHGHAVTLHNLYDANADTAGLVSAMSGKPDAADAFESAVIGAGYAGYVADSGTGRHAVLLGRHKVPVRYRGARFHAEHDQSTHGNRGGARVDDELRKTRERVTKIKDENREAKIKELFDKIPVSEREMTPAQREIETKFRRAIAEDMDGMIEKYNSLEGAEGGKVINPDLFRELSPEYKADPSGMAGAVHEPASFLSKEAFARRLATVQPGDEVMFLGGGAGSGKTSALNTAAREAYENAHTVYDYTQASFQSGVQKINAVLDLKHKGALVTDVYVARDFEGALDSAMTRAMNSGRTVPLGAYLDTHIGAREAVEQLSKHYATNPRVKFLYVDNTRGYGKAAIVDDISAIPKISRSEYADYHAKATAIIERSFAEGKISEAVRNGFLGPPREPRTRTDPGSARSDQGPRRSLGKVQQSDSEKHQLGNRTEALKFSLRHAARRVDFAVVAQRTAAIESSASADVAKLAARATRRTLTPERLRELLDADTQDIGELKLDPTDVGKIKATYRTMLDRAWSVGLSQAMDETGKIRKIRYTDAERKVKFADLRGKAADYFDANAFRMAGNLTDGMRSIIQQELQKAVRQGVRPEEVSATIYERLIRKGMTTLDAVLTEEPQEDVRDLVTGLLEDSLETANVPSYLDTLARTNIFEALNEARYAEFTDPSLDGFVEALEFSAILDDRTTQICTEMDGHIHAADSPVWDKYRPPLHYNCRSLLVAVTALDGWDGQESEEPILEPQDGF